MPLLLCAHTLAPASLAEGHGSAAWDPWRTELHKWPCHAQVKVKRRADDQKFLAQVLAIGTDCDIALLTVEDEAFWEGVKPLELGPLPTLQVRRPPFHQAGTTCECHARVKSAMSKFGKAVSIASVT